MYIHDANDRKRNEIMKNVVHIFTNARELSELQRNKLASLVLNSLQKQAYGMLENT